MAKGGDAFHQPVAVKDLAHSLPPKACWAVCRREGKNVRLSSRSARLRVRPARLDYQRREPWPEEWLLIEWPEGEKEPTKCRLSTLPGDIGLARMVDRAKLRLHVESDDQELKQEIGLGHFDGRGWRTQASP